MVSFFASPEYPDLPFARPRAWGTGRDGKAVRFIVVHYTAGSENTSSAENGVAYDQSRTDGTSTHYFVDPDSVVQCVETWHRANTALYKGNRLGIQYELCGTAQTRAQWLDASSDAILWRAAQQMARDAVKYGIPVRRLSVAEARSSWYSFPSGPKGFVGHVDMTNAFPEDGGDHTDPGAAFPWDILLARVKNFIDGGDMAIEESTPSYSDTVLRVGDMAHGTALKGPNVLHQKIDELRSKVAALEARPPVAATPVDAATLKAALLDPEVKAALLDLVRQGANLAEDS